MTSAAGMPCPVCRVGLVMSERQGVEIDYCPQCRGVWLDRGELDKIIERAAPAVVGSGAAAAPQAQPDYEQPRYEQPRYEQPRYEQPRGDDRYRYDKRRKRKNFLEELFDFD